MENRKSGISVEEAMKVLNMKKFDAEELNDKFRYRVQSVAQGLGGPITAQKDIYKAWEYLNRMLARESSTHTEDLLKKADKSMKMFEKPKRLEMIPFKLSNPARKASLIIEKSDKRKKPAKELKSILKKVKGSELFGGKLVPIRTTMSMQTAKGVNARDESHRRVRWMDDDKKDTFLGMTQTTPRSSKQFRKKFNARNMFRQLLTGKGENRMLQQEGDAEIIKSKNMNEDFHKGTKVMKFGPSSLGTLLDQLPKLATRKQRTRFKRVPGLNEIYVNPKRLSRHDQRAAAQRAFWWEESEHILKDVVPEKAERKRKVRFGGVLAKKLQQTQEEELKSDQSNGDRRDATVKGTESKPTPKDADVSDKAKRKTGGTLTQKSLQKQEEVLYSGFSQDFFPEINSGNMDLPPHDYGLQRLVDPNRVKLASKGAYTPRRIKAWIKSSSLCLNTE
uniref:Mitochondrial import inner membrane translocase subunit tim16-A n=1 Tax=Lygus hesperus TaxID=30085 RepID=A0A0A9W5K0_LYGHE